MQVVLNKSSKITAANYINSAGRKKTILLPSTTRTFYKLTASTPSFCNRHEVKCLLLFVDYYGLAAMLALATINHLAILCSYTKSLSFIALE